MGVGNNEDASPKVRGSHVCGGNPQGARSIPELSQLLTHRWEPRLRSACDVFDDDEPRADLADDAREVPPEPGTPPPQASAFSSAGDVLTGEASANKVNVWVRARLCDIDEPFNGWPVLREDRAAERVVLALPYDGPKSRALKSQLETPNPGEQRSDT
jgi:hypothetical protein